MIRMIILNTCNKKPEMFIRFYNQKALEDYLKRKHWKLQETEIFNEACNNGVIYFHGKTYHKSIELLLEEVSMVHIS